MWGAILLALVTAGIANSATVLDRIAVVVGARVVKLSDIDRDLRVTAFLNAEPLNLRPETRRKAAERLVDQQLIRTELASGGYARASDAEATTMLEQIRRGRFANSAVRMSAELGRYGLDEEQLRAQLLWQLTVLRFIDERFRSGVMATDEEIRAFYQGHPEMKKVSLEAAAGDIRRTIEGERVNQQYEEWLAGERKRVAIGFREGAFQ